MDSRTSSTAVSRPTSIFLPHFRLAAFAGLVLGAVACSSGGSGGGGGAITGSLLVLDSSGPIGEAEPNGTASQAHELGELSPGESVTVVGSITEDMGDDPLDAFRLTLPERSLVTVTLTAVDPTAPVDFGLAVFDTVSLQSVEFFDAATQNAETGTFVAGGPVFLGVVLGPGETTYEMDVTVTAAPAQVAEVEPNDVSGAAQFLGNLTLGQAISVSGSLDGGDAADRYLVAVPQAGVLGLVLDSLTGQDFDLAVRDATGDLFSPVAITSFETAADPEIGSTAIAAMTLVELEVFPFTGTGAYDLDLSFGATLTQGAGGGTSLGGASLAQVDVARISGKPRGNATSIRGLARKPALARFAVRPPVPIAIGDVLVAGHAGGSEDGLDAKLASYGGVSAVHAPGGPRRVSFALPGELSEDERAKYTAALAATLDGDPALRYAELNQYLQPLQTEPNDTFYNLQWHYPMIQLPQAWDVTTGDGNVIVAVLDTGSAPATDLLPRTIPGFDMISSAANAGDGNGYDADPTDVGDSTSSIQNSSFHGAHVAGTIGAATNDGFGVAGVTWSTDVMHVRVLGLEGGSTFDIADGIRYAARLTNSSGQLPAAQADVVNMSLGGPGLSTTMQDAITAARNAGTLLVAAAGNDDTDEDFSPAALNGVISVSAVDQRAQKAYYSNFHPTVDIAAPGGDIRVDRDGDGYPDGVLSNRPRDTVSPTQFDVFEFYQGTSMAAPHVAGVAALCLAVNPALTVAQLENVLLSTATDLGAPGRDDIFGEGLVNAFAAVQAAGGGGAGMPVLSLSSSSFLFGETSCRNAQVANLGGGTLSVTSLTPSTNSGGAWLSATAIGIATPSLSDTASIEVCVDDTGLAPGTYTGSVLVASNGGNLTIGVTLSIAGGGSTPAQTVFVLAVDAETFDTVDQDVLTVPVATIYRLGGLPDGDYVVVAGTDADDDGFICDEGEPLCGIFPSFEDPVALSVLDGGTVQDVDFPVLEAFLGGASLDLHAGGSFQGFRLLDPDATTTP